MQAKNNLEIRIQEELEQLQNRGMLRKISPVTNEEKEMDAQGQIPFVLNLSGNDYLGIATRKDLEEAFQKDYPQFCTPKGSCSSRLLTGNSRTADLLEKELALALRHEASLLFNSGYHANTAILPALAKLGKIHIIADKFVHASIIDGLRLCINCSWERFRHNDLQHLRRLLDKHSKEENIIVVVESLYSMDGDTADLPALVALKKEFPNLMLYVDEAHSFGCYGENGYGLAEHFGVLEDIDLLVGTFGKAFCSMGAFLACSELMRKYLINTARPLIFSTMLPESTLAWSRFILAQLPKLDKERTALHQTAKQLRNALQNKAYNVGSGESYIIPLIIGENTPTCSLAEKLQAEGYDIRPIRYPTVPKGTARLRLSLSSNISFKELVPLVAALPPLK